MGLKLEDIGVIEFHEAFAGQVLANITAMQSECINYYFLISLISLTFLKK